jgi:hypothetical protein
MKKALTLLIVTGIYTVSAMTVPPPGSELKAIISKPFVPEGRWTVRCNFEQEEGKPQYHLNLKGLPPGEFPGGTTNASFLVLMDSTTRLSLVSDAPRAFLLYDSNVTISDEKLCWACRLLSDGQIPNLVAKEKEYSKRAELIINPSNFVGLVSNITLDNPLLIGSTEALEKRLKDDKESAKLFANSGKRSTAELKGRYIELRKTYNGSVESLKKPITSFVVNRDWKSYTRSCPANIV